MTLQNLIQKNEFFGLERGQLVSVQDLLQQKLGRAVEFDEACQYLKKQRFVYVLQNKIITNSIKKCLK